MFNVGQKVRITRAVSEIMTAGIGRHEAEQLAGKVFEVIEAYSTYCKLDCHWSILNKALSPINEQFIFSFAEEI